MQKGALRGGIGHDRFLAIVHEGQEKTEGVQMIGDLTSILTIISQTAAMKLLGFLGTESRNTGQKILKNQKLIVQVLVSTDHSALEKTIKIGRQYGHLLKEYSLQGVIFKNGGDVALKVI